MQESYVQESLAKYGVVVVEGMNEVLRMQCLSVAAVRLGSNKATSEQIQKLIRFAQSAGQGRVVLLPDCDEEWESGFKELLWRLTEAGLRVQLGCSRAMFDGQFDGRQPEDLSAEDWHGDRRANRTHFGSEIGV